MSDTQYSCSLSPSDQEARLREFAELGSTALIEGVRTPSGARLRLSVEDGIEARLRSLIAAERRCCSFLELGVEIGDESLIVDVHGPPAARGVIDRLFELEPMAVGR
jgi:hypothetical protein